MRRLHFESLGPLCPRCALEGRGQNSLLIGRVLAERNDIIEHGVLDCPAADCGMAYPIIDGIPIIVPDLPAYFEKNQEQILARDDLPAELGGLIGDVIGPSTSYDLTRHFLSIYGWGHYADLDPEEQPPQSEAAIVRLLRETGALNAIEHGPIIDLGCSVGRSTLELAAHCSEPVLGVDLNFSMLRKGQQILRQGRFNYPRRRTGIVFDERSFEVDLPGRERVDYWACDVLALPFPAGRFACAMAFNMLDCVQSPRDFLAVLRGLLPVDGQAVLSTPFDWTPGATPAGNWIGGNRQHTGHKGDPVLALKSLLTSDDHPLAVKGFDIVEEIEDAHWTTRLHERSTVNYNVLTLILGARKH